MARTLKSDDVLERLSWLFATRGVPEHIRSDNSPEFTAKMVRSWMKRVGVQTLFIEPGNPWENVYVESFNGKLRDERLNSEIFYTLKEAKVLIECWRVHYNTVRPHGPPGRRDLAGVLQGARVELADGHTTAGCRECCADSHEDSN